MEFVTENKAFFDKYRAEYPLFSYDKYEWSLNYSTLTLNFTYSFSPSDTIKTSLEIKLPGEVSIEDIKSHEDYIFRIGLIDALSYWKAYCSPMVNIACGSLNDFEISWWKNIWHDGLGEFRYRNGLLSVKKEDWVEITCGENNYKIISHDFSNLNGNLIAFTGGKDSTLSLGIFKDVGGNNNETFVINPSSHAEKIKEILGVQAYPETVVLRTVHPHLIELNKQGALNGHTPFSAVVSFIGIFVASLRSKKYFIVSNESSASEATVPGTDINHQYSKSLTFEKSFQEYCNNVWTNGPLYVSILRPITEIGIACMLNKYEATMPYISSCNIKSKTGLWCGKCPKCFFASMLFSSVWDIDFTTKIIGVNMFDTLDNMEMLLELTGIAETKPFECIGTTEESRAILSKIYMVKDSLSQPVLKKFYELHKNILPDAGKFNEIAAEFNESLLPVALEDIIKNAHEYIIK